MQSCIILIIHDRYPVNAMKSQRKCNIVFSGNTGFRGNKREKRKGNKNFKVFFLYFYFDLYNIRNSFPVIYCTRKRCTFCVSHFFIFVLLTLFSFFRFYSHLPLSSAPLTLSPCPGTAYGLYSFLLKQNKRGQLTFFIISFI